jgi:hypothetical protein
MGKRRGWEMKMTYISGLINKRRRIYRRGRSDSLEEGA